MSSLNFDTIVGISTPIGVGAIGIVRVSGNSATDILAKLCPNYHSIKPRYVKHTEIRAKNGDVIDDACVVYFKGPQSYTGEDSLEFQCHSNPLILNQLVSACIDAGARLAEPGEFTKRAVIHGKMDVLKAESVIDIIHASSDLSKQVSLNRLNGKLYKTITTFRKQLMEVVEQIEGSVDFPEEVPELEPKSLLNALNEVRRNCQRILRMQDFGKVVYQGVNVVILGEPNAGKSSLLNAFVGENRAIVTSIPGTTRDYIECQVSMGGGLFNIIDTAGVRDQSIDVIEKKGMRKIKGLINRSDVVIVAIDGTNKVSKQQEQLFHMIPSKKKIIVVLTKADKKRAKQTLEKRINECQTLFKDTSLNAPILPVSAKTSEGMHNVQKTLIDQCLTPNDEVDTQFLCNIRQIQCLKQALKGLDTAKKSLNAGFEQDIISFELKKVVEVLGELTGDDLTEEMLDGIFSRFCVGK